MFPINDSMSTNIAILQRTNELFDLTQKRVASGKSVFTAADDTTRYRVSENLLGRSRQLSSINNNISLGLATLETTDNTLKQMLGLVQSALTLVSKAQNEGANGVRATETTAPIDPTTVVSGVSVGSLLSITSDSGRTFTYTFNSTTVTWGEVANALNVSNIGVQADFIPGSVAGTTNLRFRSVNDEDFSFDAVTDQNVMDDLIGLTSPTGQVFNPNNLFANGVLAPAAGETGFTVSYGGHVTGNAGGGVTLATAIAAGSSIVFEDGNGQFRTLNYGAGTTVGGFITDVTALGAGIKAELVNQSGGAGGPLQLRMRNMNGSNMKIVAATGDFATAGPLGMAGITTAYAAPLSQNYALRLAYGQQYDAILENIDSLAANNPVPDGRNLLQAENISVMLDDFSSNPIKLAGVALTAAGYLTMAQSGATWANDGLLQNSATQARQAETILLELQAQFATFNNYIRSRYDLNKAYLGDSKVLGDEIVAADTTEESASLVALQTRQQFAVQALSIGNQAQQSLLRLLGG
ncbi:flagellin [Rhabdaerophilum sp. SD176]|uniref:flagellin N-terminal helical domain-containing protein n=1 Tax=Rhabdaerophilum sp. SD176 TaxID=2983548 RepID=UPI0024DF3F38|nr:flagellin [Rhabdaerophilum sp. SD176]